ncbi:MAG TPA: penicillin-binding protein 2 [Actinomycetota bacterium]|nr:penicillin-binding protein 2 [Actinomycetota bacterium]
MRRRGARPALRLLALLGACSFGLIAIGGRLVHLQVVKASAYEDLGAKQRIRKMELPARRGAIYDRNGVPLAVSVDARAIYANPQFIDDPEGTAVLIAKHLGTDTETILTRLTKKKSGFVYLARKVDIAAANAIMNLDLPGIGTLDETKRVYPQGTLAGQVLGFVGTDNQGLSGLEATFDEVLAGTPGEQIVEVDPQGRPIASGVRSVREPVRGRDIVLTIDRDVQFQAERAVADAVIKWTAKHGMAVVMDSQSNEILAMANYPPFDPARFGDYPVETRRNRAVQDAYEPGSVNKLVTAAAAVESGLVRPGEMMTVPYRTFVGKEDFTDFEPHPTWNITYNEVLAKSSNVGTIQVAQKIGGKRLYEMLTKFGFGKRTGVEFGGESPGISLAYEKWSKTSLATISIGHGIAVTPLQMLNVYTTLARDGIWKQPRLVTTVGDDERKPSQQPRRVASTFTTAQLRGMLMNVVENGTGRNARIPGYLVGGKTGTARKPNVGKRGYGSAVFTTFIGMVPVDRPRFVVGVVLDEPSLHMAAATAAPAFQKITSYVLARWGVPPQVVPPEKEYRKSLQPARAPAPPAPPKPAATPATKPTASPVPKPSASPAPERSGSPSPKPSASAAAAPRNGSGP